MENNVEGAQKREVANGRRKRCRLSCIAIELYEKPPQSDNFLIQIFYNLVHSLFIFLSKLRLGQIMISILDYYMVKIENTLDFCTPNYFEFANDEVIERHRRLPVKDRPMAWIFFIPALIFLRILRFSLSVYCIITCKGEVTARDMQLKIISFRRYYRSIRHYAVNKWTEDDKKIVEERKSSKYWRIYYYVYETLMMTKPRVERHFNNDDPIPVDNEEPAEKPKANGREKRKRLNVSSSSSSSSSADDSDKELNPLELMEKYVDLNSSADPDYKPEDSSNLNSTFDSTLGTDEEREKTESQLKLNEEIEGHGSNTYSSDIERSETDKSNDSLNSLSSSLTPSQMNELEKEIMAKILNYFKENHNFPSNNDNLPEIFYSPLDSPPPEKAYSSDSEVHNNQQQ